MLEINIKKYVDDEILFQMNEIITNGIFLISGENGSGKTTILNIIAGLDEEYEGEVKFLDCDINELDKKLYRNQHICYLLQNPVLYEDLNCSQNLELIVGAVDSVKLNTILKKLQFEKIFKSRKSVKKLSGGELQKLNVIINLLKNASIYLIDEVENNLDKSSVEAVSKLIAQLGGVVIIVSHNDYQFKDIIDTELHISDRIVKKILINEQVQVAKTDEVGGNKQSLSNKDIKTLGALNIYNRILFTILLGIIFIVLSIVISNVTFVSQYLVRPEGNFNNNAMLVSSPINGSLYDALGTNAYTKQIPYNFTDQDLKALQSLEGVENVTSIGSLSGDVGSTSLYLENGIYSVDKTINYEKLDYAKYGLEQYELPAEFVPVAVSNLVYPYVVYANTPMTPGINLSQLLFGDYPQDETNQVMIDVYMAMKLASQNSFDNIEEVVGTTFKLPFTDNETGKSKELSFEVSGIYVPNKQGQENVVYYSYTPQAEIVMRNNCSLYPDKSAHMYDICLASDADLDYMSNITSEQQAEIGDYPAFYLEASDDQSEKEIYDAIKDYNPYIDIDSNYARTKITSFIYLKSYIFKLVLELIIVFLLFIVALIGVKKLMNIEFDKVEKVLNHFGFADSEVLKVKKHEYKIIVNILVIIAISYLIYRQLRYGFSAGFVILYIVLVILIVLIQKRVVNKEQKWRRK